MEGLNSTCLGIFLCPVALLIGGIAFAALSPAFKSILTKKSEGRYADLSVIPAGGLALVVACVVFYLMYAPTFPGYYQPFWRPNENDIVGTWTPTEGTAFDIKRAGYPASSPSFEFRENGDFIMTDVPDMVFEGRHELEEKFKFYSGEGTWRLEKDFQNTWFVMVNLSSLTPPYHPDPQYSRATPCPGKSVPCNGLGDSYEVWGSNPPYLLGVIRTEFGSKYFFVRQGDVHEEP